MKTHIINCSEVTYPVGLNMSSAMKFVKEVYKFIRDNDDFRGRDINLLCTGSSGSIIASLLFAELDQENVLSSLDDINVIIDDFSSSGETIERIYSKVKQYNSDIDINYLILSGIGTDSVYIIKEVIQPQHIVSSKQGIDNFNNPGYESN
jgi:hypothetical protein